MCNHWGNWQIVFQSGYVLFYIPASCLQKFQFFLILTISCYFLTFWHFLILAILVKMKWYLMVLLVCIFLMANDIRHLFLCLLTIYMSVWILCPVLIGLSFCYWVIRVLYLFLIQASYQIHDLINVCTILFGQF